MKNLTINTTSTKITGNGLIQVSVIEFKGYAKKTAENILEMGRVVFEAKKNLKTNKGEFEAFCAGVGFKSDSSSIKKLAQIGKAYSFMKSHADHLPNNWTTVYEIARLTEDQLNTFIDQGLIHQNVLGSVIKTLNGSKRDDEAVSEKIILDKEKLEEAPNRTLNGLTFTCTLKNVSDVAFKAKLQMLLSKLEELQVEIILAPELKSALQPPVQQAA